MKENEILYMYDESNCCVFVLEDGSYIQKNISSKTYLKNLCFKYARDIEEQRKFIQKFLPIYRKTPLVLDVEKELIFFPVYGRRNKENLWIQFGKIKKVKEEGMNCKLIFLNDIHLLLPCQKRTIQRQRNRCKKILHLLNNIIV